MEEFFFHNYYSYDSMKILTYKLLDYELKQVTEMKDHCPWISKIAYNSILFLIFYHFRFWIFMENLKPHLQKAVSLKWYVKVIWCMSWITITVRSTYLEQLVEHCFPPKCSNSNLAMVLNVIACMSKMEMFMCARGTTIVYIYTKTMANSLESLVKVAVLVLDCWRTHELAWLTFMVTS